jgi:hypothetical protein
MLRRIQVNTYLNSKCMRICRIEQWAHSLTARGDQNHDIWPLDRASIFVAAVCGCVRVQASVRNAWSVLVHALLFILARAVQVHPFEVPNWHQSKQNFMSDLCVSERTIFIDEPRYRGLYLVSNAHTHSEGASREHIYTHAHNNEQSYACPKLECRGKCLPKKSCKADNI